jgi:hypothetical protein
MSNEIQSEVVGEPTCSLPLILQVPRVSVMTSGSRCSDRYLAGARRDDVSRRSRHPPRCPVIGSIHSDGDICNRAQSFDSTSVPHTEKKPPRRPDMTVLRICETRSSGLETDPGFCTKLSRQNRD